MPLPGPKQADADSVQIVFIFFTILYQLKTLLILNRIQHKSPVYGSSIRLFPSLSSKGR